MRDRAPVSGCALPLRDCFVRGAVRWRHECAGFPCLAQRHDRTWWLDGLRRLKGDPFAMDALRSLIAQWGPALRPITDRETFRQAALALERGELCVCDQEAPREFHGGGGGEPADVQPAASTAEPAPPPRAERSPGPQPEPDSLAPDASQGAIAESHRRAARLGIALCEECLKQAEADGGV